MCRTACTEPQCLYSRAIPLLPLLAVRPVQNLSACTVELYLYSPYWPYGLYRASVPVQYSYTSTPLIGHTACTDPQCLYSRAIPLLPLLAVRPVQSLIICTRLHFTFFTFIQIKLSIFIPTIMSYYYVRKYSLYYFVSTHCSFGDQSVVLTECNCIPDEGISEGGFIKLFCIKHNLATRVQFLLGARYFSLSILSTQALGPTQPPVKWVRGYHSSRVKWQWV